MTNKHLITGQIVKYIGRGFKDFDISSPFMTFLGYDGQGWSEIWVNYNNRFVTVNIKDIEIADNDNRWIKNG